MAEANRALAIGEIVAFYRRQRGWTQQALAMRLNRSVGWVRGIEQGARPVDSVRVVLELSEVLGVAPGKLTGKPIAPPPKGPHMPEPAGVLLELRRVLLHYDGIHGLNDAQGDTPRPLEDLERDTSHAWHLYETNKNNFSGVVWLLPRLLRETRRAERAASEGSSERRAAWRVLTKLYRLAAWELYYHGEDDLAWIAADRAVSAAEQADDALLAAAGARALQQVLLAHGQLGDVIALGDTATAGLIPSRDASPERLTVWGSLRLLAAFAAARLQDRAEHERLWGSASQAAERLGQDRKDLHLDFGPAMAAIQRVGMLVELYEPRAALRMAEAMPADPLPTVDRRCFHRMHQAKARFLRRDDSEAFGLLVQAERIAPEIVRYQPMAREMVRALLRRRRTRVPQDVRALAERLEVVPG